MKFVNKNNKKYYIRDLNYEVSKIRTMMFKFSAKGHPNSLL